MNKLFNWTFGSFFRTLGRFLFYLLIGFLISQLINISDIKLPSLFNILDVYADTTIKIYNTTLTSSNYVVVPTGSHVINIIDDDVYGQYGGAGSFPPQYYIGTFCTDSDNIITWQGTSMSSSGGSGTTIANTLSQINFFNTKYNCMFPNSSYAGGHIVYVYGKINAVWSTSGTTAYLMGRIEYTQPDRASWSLLNWSFSDSVVSVDYSSQSIITQNSQIITQNNSIIQKQQDMIDKITQQTQQQHQDSLNVQDKIDDVNDTLTDDSIDNNSISNFVDSMDNEPSSLTPFSDFINLPLTWVQSLLASNQNCQTIRLPLPYMQNKTLDLPCMTDFWDRMGSLKTLIELVWIAIVGVRIFNGLFLLTCEVIDPNPDQDMTKLRTWEL